MELTKKLFFSSAWSFLWLGIDEQWAEQGSNKWKTRSGCWWSRVYVVISFIIIQRQSLMMYFNEKRKKYFKWYPVTQSIHSTETVSWNIPWWKTFHQCHKMTVSILIVTFNSHHYHGSSFCLISLSLKDS